MPGTGVSFPATAELAGNRVTSAMTEKHPAQVYFRMKPRTDEKLEAPGHHVFRELGGAMPYRWNLTTPNRASCQRRTAPGRALTCDVAEPAPKTP